MKIDPSEKQHSIISPNAVKPVDRDTKEEDFAKILGDTVKNTSDSQMDKSGVVRPSMAPSMAMSIGPEPGSPESATAHGLLNALEHYQKLLGDPEADLKTVAPAVDHMQLLSKKAQPILDNMPDGHPVKTITSEALVEMSKEIERFSAGYYVDE